MTARVVAGVLVEEGRILLTQRQPDVPFPYVWECPGGKRQEGEEDVAALRREWMEELNLDVEVGDVVCATVLQRPSVEVPAPLEVVHYRVARRPAGYLRRRPQMLASVGLGWFVEAELRALRGTPSLERGLHLIVRELFR